LAFPQHSFYYKYIEISTLEAKIKPAPKNINNTQSLRIVVRPATRNQQMISRKNREYAHMLNGQKTKKCDALSSHVKYTYWETLITGFAEGLDGMGGICPP
jgi:hypothetical protein